MQCSERLEKQVTDRVFFSHFLFFQKGKMSLVGEMPVDAEQCRPRGRDDANKNVSILLFLCYFQVCSVVLLTLLRPIFIYCGLSNCETTKAGVSTLVMSLLS